VVLKVRVGVRVRVGMGVSIGGKECMIVCAIEVKDRGWLGYIVKVKGCTCEDTISVVKVC